MDPFGILCGCQVDPCQDLYLILYYELGFSSNLIGALKHLKIMYLRFYKYLCNSFNELINTFKGIFTFLCNDPKLDLWGKDQRKSILSLG